LFPVKATLFSLCCLISPIGNAQPRGGSQPLQVAVFLACDCPISQKYVPILNEIYKTYKDRPGIEWSFVVPGKVKAREVREFVSEYQVEFPITHGAGSMRAVEDFHAETTPQVVIRSTRILYTGAIDNWYFDLGQYRQITTENYMTQALEAVLAGKEPPIKQTKAVGCPIARRANK
jgi:hypothetical protein